MRSFRLLFAIRSLMKNKFYALLNILGLAIGLAASIIIYLYLHSEASYDKHFSNYKNIYRVHSNFQLESEDERFAGTSLNLAPLLKEEYDYIDEATRFFHIDYNVLFKRGDKQIYEEQIAVADSNFFKVFNLAFIEGNPATALSKPHSIVVTESFAGRYFPDGNPVGKVISTNNYDYTITGLIKDLPANTHHNFDAVISAFYQQKAEEDQLKSLWQVSIYTFLRLDEPGEAERLEKDFLSFYDKYMHQLGEHFNGRYTIELARIDDIHFGNEVQFDQPQGSTTYFYGFGAIGALILVLACINYVNMATARGMQRVKEAGLRKILGSSEREIRILILAESFVLSLISLFIAFVLVELILVFTPFNAIMNKDLSLDFWRFPALWWLPLSLACLVGLLSGWYPAVNLGKVPGLAVIRGSFKAPNQNATLRKFLIGVQFCTSVAVVITALLMHRQIEYIRNKDLGFNKEDIVLVPLQDTVLAAKLPEIEQRLRESPHVLATSVAWSVPGNNLDRTLLSIEQNNSLGYHKNVVDVMHVGLNYLETMQIKLLRGRDFREKDLQGLQKAVLVNQSLVKEMGWNKPIGKKVKWGFDASGNELFEAHVAGVIADFNSHSLHNPIEPTVLFLQDRGTGSIHIRIDSEHLMAAIKDVEKVWGKADSKNPFRFSFLNSDLMNLYQEENRQSRLILYLTYLTIFISFLGLTGLASFTTGLRTREIGIRKVLGANIYQMVNILFKDILLLVILSVALALPLAYLLITGWLSAFAYSAKLDPGIFAFSAILALMLAYLVVMYHSVRVARTNPVDTLKHE